MMKIMTDALLVVRHHSRPKRVCIVIIPRIVEGKKIDNFFVIYILGELFMDNTLKKVSERIRSYFPFNINFMICVNEDGFDRKIWKHDDTHKIFGDFINEDWRFDIYEIGVPKCE